MFPFSLIAGLANNALKGLFCVERVRALTGALTAFELGWTEVKHVSLKAKTNVTFKLNLFQSAM